MKRFGLLILTLLLSLLVLTGCVLANPKDITGFDALARWVPGDARATNVSFLDLRPGGETGRLWDRIRKQLEANPAGQDAIAGIYNQYRVEYYGLGDFISGPAVTWYGDSTEYIIAQLSDEAAAEDALRKHFGDEPWEQEIYQGKTLYFRDGPISWSPGDQLAWTIHDGLLFLADQHGGKDSLSALRALMSLAPSDSLGALPPWRTLRDRLPENPMGLIFLNVGEELRNNPPAANNLLLTTAVNGQIDAVALAVMPENKGIRAEMVGTVVLQEDTLPEIRALFSSPVMDPSAWAGLPSGTAIVLMGHDLSILWPWMKEAFGLEGDYSKTVGLDLEVDLAGADGPLSGSFAMAITPPLPEQPVSQGLPAGQMLILTRDASLAQMKQVQASMEGRGAIFGPRELEGITLQTQAGTEPSGYAISYGFEDDTLFFGTSLEIIGQGLAARREGTGLVTTQSFQTVMAFLPDDPTLVLYINPESLANLMKAYMSERQYRSQGTGILEAFEAVSFGLRLTPNELDGTFYFFVP